ncbi:MAG: PKD domain-containing protein, partial [Mariniphaga sp.]|nr:PKD domain-containing protein [Mariniphaga sp.]
MKTKAYIGEFSRIVSYIFACLFLTFAFSANGQNPLLEDADQITPFGNCDLVPTKLNPDYILTVNNISTDKANIASYKISWGDGSTVDTYPANFTSTIHTYLSLGIFSLVFTAIDNAGVETVKSYSVSNQSNPAIGISNNGGNTIGCSPLALSFTITEAANNAPGTYYEIDYGDGSAIETKTLQQVLDNNVINHIYINSSCDPPGINGQFTFKVKAINSCTATPANMGAIIVYKSPIPKFSTSVNDNGCINTAISFNNLTKSGSGYNCNSTSDIYLWTFGDGITSTDKNPSHTYTASGNYSVSLTSSNGQCVSVRTTLPLPLCISPKPIADFALSTPTVCKGTAVSVVNNSITENTCGNLIYTWTVSNYVGSVNCLPNASSWHFNTGSNENSANPSFVFDNAGTYRINLTVSNGCGTISTFKTIMVKQVPSVKINPVNAICVNQTITPTALVNDCFGETTSNYNWQFTGGMPSVSTLKDPSAITYSAAGTYDILLSATNECGTSVATPVKLKVNNLPNPVINGPAIVCANSKGNVYSTTPGMMNYQWVVSAGGVITSGNTQTSNSITIDWKDADNQTVGLNYSQFGCTSQTPSILNVSVNPLPVPYAGNPVTICSGEPVHIGGAANVGSSYSWVSIPAGFGSSASNPTVTPLLTTEYILTETTVLTGCSASKSVIITVNPLPIPLIHGPAAVCIDSENVVYTANAGMTNYQWTVSPGGTITAGGTLNSNTISVTWNQEGNQSISLNYTNDKGCTAAVPLVYNVAVNTSQIVLLEGPESICEQSSGNIYTALPGMTNYVWVISPEGTLISGGDAVSNTAEIKWNNPGTKTVSIIYTQPGCESTIPAVVNVTVNPRSLPVITGESIACAGSVNVKYTTKPGMSNYTWELSPGGNITTGIGTNEIKVTWNTPGNQFVKVNYEGTAICPSLIPSIFNVTVNQLQNPTITGVLETCQGLSAVEYATEPGMSSYLWKVSAGGTISAGFGTDRISVVWKTAGVQNVSVSYLNNAGCSSTVPVNISVKVNPSPLIVAFPETQEICSGSLATIQLKPSDGIVNYSWSAETISGTVLGAASGTGSTIAQQLINTETTVAIVRYTILSSNGTCAGTPVYAEVKVRNLSPTITGLSKSCARTKGVIYTTEPGMDNYNWVVSAGGAIKSGAGTNSITVDWYIVGNQTVSISYGNSAGCTGNSVAVYSVKVNPLPAIAIASPTVVCAGSPVTFTTEAGMSDYRWIAGEGITVADGTSASNSITVLWNNPGSYLMTVNYANSNGCSASFPLMSEIIVLPVPAPTLSGPQNVCANSGSILYMTQPGKVKYNWMISGGQIISGGTLTTNSATVVWDNSSDHSIRVNYSNGECMA